MDPNCVLKRDPTSARATLLLPPLQRRLHTPWDSLLLKCFWRTRGTYSQRRAASWKLCFLAAPTTPLLLTTSVTSPLLSQIFYYSALNAGYLSLEAKKPPPHICFTSMFVSCLTWLLYGLAAGSVPMWLPNATGLAVATVTCWKLNSVKPLGATVWGVVGLLSAVVLALQFGGVVTPKAKADEYTGLLGNVVAVVMLCSGTVTWPTIVSTGDASGLEKDANLQMAGFANSIAWAAMGNLQANDHKGDKLLIIPNLIGLVCNVICFGFILKYGSGARNNTMLAFVAANFAVYWAIFNLGGFTVPKLLTLCFNIQADAVDLPLIAGVSLVLLVLISLSAGGAKDDKKKV